MKDLHFYRDAVTSQTASPLLPQTDLVGYNSLIEFLTQYRIGQIDGDFLEIGCFLGGGTAKLAQLATALGKRVWVIDIFDPDFDETKNAGGQSMARVLPDASPGSQPGSDFQSRNQALDEIHTRYQRGLA